MNNLVKRSLLNAAGTIAYIAIVGTVMRNADHLFGQVQGVLQPIVVLMLLVISATITAGLVLGKPLLMYLDGKKPEAIKLFLFTLGWLVLALILIVGLALI